MEINYKESKEIIESYYNRLGLTDEFEKDNNYLEKAFNEIKRAWIENFDKIEQVKYLLIAEAPLWGQQQKKFTTSKLITLSSFIGVIWRKRLIFK